MGIIEIIAAIWIVIGIYYWIRMPNQEFKPIDIFIGLPLVILLWPRIKDSK